MSNPMSCFGKEVSDTHENAERWDFGSTRRLQLFERVVFFESASTVFNKNVFTVLTTEETGENMAEPKMSCAGS